MLSRLFSAYLFIYLFIRQSCN